MAWKDINDHHKYHREYQKKYRRERRGEYLAWLKDYHKRTKDARRKAALRYASSPKGRYHHAVNSSKRRKLLWDIPFEYFAELISKPCHYCDGDLDNTGTGLDRLNNNFGYILGNVVPSCGECNMFRGNRLSAEETRIAMQAIRSYRLIPIPPICTI